jgi:hypothetical protein
MGKKVLASVTGLLLFGALLIGQDVGFTATTPPVVKVGEQFQYIIEGSKRGNVKLPSMDRFKFLGGPFSSYSSRSQRINGKMTQATLVSYTYLFSAADEGSFTIPSATVKVGKKEYATNEVNIEVHSRDVGSAGQGRPHDSQGVVEEAVSSSEEDPVFLRVIPSKREVYVGEQFVSGLKVYTRVNTRPGSSASELPYEGFYKTNLDPDTNPQQQDINGQAYISQVIQRHILIPQKRGDLVIVPYESDWMVQQRVQRQGGNPLDNFFDDPFFNGYQDVPVTLATLPVTIHVKSLPSGAPESLAVQLEYSR